MVWTASATAPQTPENAPVPVRNANATPLPLSSCFLPYPSWSTSLIHATTVTRWATSPLGLQVNGKAQPMPTYRNQLGRQSSLFSQASPSVKRPLTHPLHLGELGQLKKGICW